MLLLGGVGLWFAVPYVVPIQTLFRWSRPSLDQYAANVMVPGSTTLAHPPRRLGFFNVLKTEPLSHGFVFQHDSCNPFDWCGIAYSTEPLPEFDRMRKATSNSRSRRWAENGTACFVSDGRF